MNLKFVKIWFKKNHETDTVKTLENENQIVRQKNNVTTLISIVNYNEYQTDDKANSKPNSKANSKPNSKANGHKQE